MRRRTGRCIDVVGGLIQGQFSVVIEEGFFPQKARKGAAVLTTRTSFGMTGCFCGGETQDAGIKPGLREIVEMGGSGAAPLRGDGGWRIVGRQAGVEILRRGLLRITVVFLGG